MLGTTAWIIYSGAQKWTRIASSKSSSVISSSGPTWIVPAFAHPAGLFGIRKLGGWATFQRKFLAPDTGYLTQIETELGELGT